MAVSVTHARGADDSFSGPGKEAWEDAHTVTGLGTLATQDADAALLAIKGDTWANRVNYQTTNFNLLRVTDTALAGSVWYWNGSVWRPLGGSALLGSSAASVSGAGDTAENIAATVTVPGGAMGLNGALRIFVTSSANNDASAKTVRVRFGGIGGTIYQQSALANTITHQAIAFIQNRGAENSQVGGHQPAVANMFSVSGAVPATSSLDTASDQDIVITLQKADGADTLTLERYSVELLA